MPERASLMGLADYFALDEHDTDVRTEVLAGVTTFFAMSYIVLVNPATLGQAISIPGYTGDQVQQMLAVVTIISAFVATTVMALYANRPFAQAPGLGLNAFFAYTVVIGLGIPWQVALAAVFVEGIIFILLTAAGARKAIIRAFPEPVKLAVGAGIGGFLALIGLQEMGVVAADQATMVTLGQIATDPAATLAIAGLFFTLALYARGVPGSIVVGILGTTVAAYVIEWAGVVAPGTLTTTITGAQYDITPLAGAFLDGLVGAPAEGIDMFAFALIVFTFFFVDFFDTAGTLVGVGQVAGFLDEDGNLPDIDKPLMADAIGTTIGSMLGTSTVTTYIESATGVEEGGRTGLTALVVAVLFLASLAVVPLAAIVPLYASHIALVVVGVIMLANVTDVAWDDMTYAIPAGLTVFMMPFTYNIGYGIAAGIVSYPVVKVAVGEYDEVSAGQWLLALAFVVYFYVRTSGTLAAAV
jgi:AGZA family xanthine/uracil permease-like MFS transporter